MKLDFVTILMNLKVVTEQSQENENKESMIDQIKKSRKIGRNEPCFCGSGKKFKHCCGAV